MDWNKLIKKKKFFFLYLFIL